MQSIHLYTNWGASHYTLQTEAVDSNTLQAKLQIDDGKTIVAATCAATEAGPWQYFAGQWSPEPEKKALFFLNGDLQDQTTNTALSETTGYGQVRLGGYIGKYFKGAISEARISNTVRSPSWIKTTRLALFDNLLNFALSEALDSDGDGLVDDAELSVYGTDPTLTDTDADGLADGLEVSFWANQWNADSDNDNMINLLDPDADNDGLTDGDEVTFYQTNPAAPDTDADNLTDRAELDYWGTNWNTDPDIDGLVNLLDPDSDNDGLLDGDEINTHHSDPANPDTDGDGLSDGVEVNTHNTSPVKADSDGDGLSDYDEIHTHGTDPALVDGDNDTLPDWWELVNFGDLTQNGSGDSDNDGVSNYLEYEVGTNPTDATQRPAAGTFYQYDSKGRIKKLIRIR